MFEVTLGYVSINIQLRRGQSQLQPLKFLSHGSKSDVCFLVIGETRCRQTLEHNGEKVVERQIESVLPLSGEIK